jgi:peroxiredoxin Q/BCP
LNTVVIGISVDNIQDQEKFTAKEKLNYPLLADPEKKVVKEYGVLMDRGFAQRATFVMDKKGVIRKIYNPADAQKNADEVLNYIKENLKD